MRPRILIAGVIVATLAPWPGQAAEGVGPPFRVETRGGCANLALSGCDVGARSDVATGATVMSVRDRGVAGSVWNGGGGMAVSLFADGAFAEPTTLASFEVIVHLASAEARLDGLWSNQVRAGWAGRAAADARVVARCACSSGSDGGVIVANEGAHALGMPAVPASRADEQISYSVTVGPAEGETAIAPGPFEIWIELAVTASSAGGGVDTGGAAASLDISSIEVIRTA